MCVRVWKFNDYTWDLPYIQTICVIKESLLRTHFNDYVSCLKFHIIIGDLHAFFGNYILCFIKKIKIHIRERETRIYVHVYTMLYMYDPNMTLMTG